MPTSRTTETDFKFFGISIDSISIAPERMQDRNIRPGSQQLSGSA